MKDGVNVGNSLMDGYSSSCHFPVIGGTPHGSSRLRSYGLVKLEAPKNGQEAPSWLQVFNERVKWL
jgi:hypothetical protein